MADPRHLEKADLRPGAINWVGGPPPERPPPSRLQRFRNWLADRIEDLAWRVRGPEDLR